MEINDSVIRNDEKAVFTLRSLYEEYGYKQYKMNKFEEYDFYVRNKDFLVSDNVITFTDTNGRLMALKPDVTLSIIKNSSDKTNTVEKVYYNENVYRISGSSGSYKEIMQAGLECIGATDKDCINEVLLLAAKSLNCITDDFVLDISHMGVINEIMETLDITEKDKQKILKCIGEKNFHDIKDIAGSEKLQKIVTAYGSLNDVLPILENLFDGILSPSAKSLIDTAEFLENSGFKGKIRIDFSVLNDMNYYSGIVFKGFVSNISGSILSGGQYNNLMRKMGKSADALGFAVYLDMLDRFYSADTNIDEKPQKKVLNVALPKGRLGEKVYGMFEKAGFPCPSIKETNRKLIFENEELSLRYFWVKPSDVAIYVEHGAADIGVCGKDILLEYSPDVYELCDLNTGKCKMAVAAKNGFCDDTKKTLRIATKFSNITKNYYNSKGRDIDIIHLNGSIEIAPILDLSDVIVDIVETGTTLKENNLSVIESIVPISARLIANKSSFKFKNEQIEEISKSLKSQTEEKND